MLSLQSQFYKFTRGQGEAFPCRAGTSVAAARISPARLCVSVCAPPHPQPHLAQRVESGTNAGVAPMTGCAHVDYNGAGMTDLLFSGGPVLTMDAARTRSQALLVRGNRIVAVGTEPDVRAAAGPEAVTIDLHGRALLPGFNDAHIHALNLAEQESWIDLKGLSKNEIIDRLKTESSALPPGEVLFGGNWDYPACPDPHIRDLDQAFPDRPVLLFQFSGHGGWANTAALRMLHI
ncbi:MAG: hypothetical protein E4H09_04100, partial [Spirochaetales bacterium]